MTNPATGDREPTTRIWFDTEFIEDGKTIELLSIGLVREDGATYYAEPAEADHSRASDWVKQNVLPHLTGETKPRAVIAREIIEFAGKKPVFWAYYADYDWVALCQLYGTMMDLPAGWPMFCQDVKQFCVSVGNPDLPKQNSTEHNALDDAIWTRDAFNFLRAPTPRPSSNTIGGELAETIKFLGWVSDSYLAHAKCTDVADEIIAYEGSAEMARDHASRLSALQSPQYTGEATDAGSKV